MGQVNLVPNAGFEDYYSCPQASGEIYKLKNWFNAGGSPDYFNICGSNLLDPPNNLWGYQYPSTGDAYSGVFGFVNITGAKNLRELISTQLTSTLSIGTKYFVSFKTSAAFLSQASQVNIFTNNMGALFTKYKSDSIGVAPNKWHIINTSISNDTTNWVRIKGSFIADSSYKYIIIGNLKDSSSIIIDSTIAYQQGYIANSSYYYIDDVCVSTDSLYTYNFSTTFLKSYNTNKNYIQLYPNPANDFLLLDTKVSLQKIKIINCYGLIEKEINFNQNINTCKINLEDLSSGVYLIEIVFNPSHKRIEKLIIKK